MPCCVVLASHYSHCRTTSSLRSPCDGGVGSSASSRARDVTRTALCFKASVCGVALPVGATDELNASSPLRTATASRRGALPRAACAAAPSSRRCGGVGAVTALAVLPSPDKRRADAFAARTLLALRGTTRSPCALKRPRRTLAPAKSACTPFPAPAAVMLRRPPLSSPS
jgi:hypothetical protein